MEIGRLDGDDRSTHDRLPARRAAAVLCVLLGLPAAGPGRSADGRPSEDALRTIEQGGRRIAQYHEAIAEGSEQLRRETGSAAADRVVVARRDGWHVFFLKQPETPKSSRVLRMVADVRFNPTLGEVAAVRVEPSPRPAPVEAQTYHQALQAAEVASSVRSEARPPFERSIFKDSDRGDRLLVYLQSLPETGGTVRFGADLRITLSVDGKQVQGIEPLHAEATVIALPSGKGGQPTLHTHSAGDLPTETDVALVLRHPELAPHLVLTPRHIFRIEADGRIIYIGANAPPPSGAPAAP